jgi:hypothetical protein
MSKENTSNKKIINPIMTIYTGIHSVRGSGPITITKTYTRINWFHVFLPYRIGIRVCLKKLK